MLKSSYLWGLLTPNAGPVARKRPGYKILRTIKGVGELLAATILYETGDIRRFPAVGNYASYC